MFANSNSTVLQSQSPLATGLGKWPTQWPMEKGKWLSQSYILKALRIANKSAPGPDGIPYQAYQAVPRAAEILHRCFVELFSVDDLVLPQSFNFSRLTCIPKKPAGTDPVLGDYYTVDATRPISVVDTANRLLALAGKNST